MLPGSPPRSRSTTAAHAYIRATIGRVLALFSRLMRPRAYVTDISLAGMPTRAPSMLLDTIRVGPNTYMGVSRACDEAMAAPSSVTRALLDPFLRGVTFLATEGLDEILANKANQQCHFKSSRWRIELLDTDSCRGTVPMEPPMSNSSMRHPDPDLDFDDTRMILQGDSCTIAALVAARVLPIRPKKNPAI